jgi:hypothetical protein
MDRIAQEQEDQSVVALQQEYDRITGDVRYAKSIIELKQFIHEKHQTGARNLFEKSEGKGMILPKEKLMSLTEDVKVKAERETNVLKNEWRKIPEQILTAEDTVEQIALRDMIADFRESKQSLRELKRTRKQLRLGEQHVYIPMVAQAEDLVTRKQSGIIQNVWKNNAHPNVLVQAFEAIIDGENKSKVRSAKWDIAHASNVLHMDNSRDPQFRKIVDEFRSTDYGMHTIDQVDKNMTIIEQAFKEVFYRYAYYSNLQRLRQASLIYIFGERVADKGK